MVATDANIDSFVQNSMAFIRKYNFDGIDLDWQFPAFCESEDRCSPVEDAARFKILLEKFRYAIESENVSPENKMLISSSGGHKKNQIYKANDDTSTTSTTSTTSSTTSSTTALNSISTSAPLQGPAAVASNETTTFVVNSTEVSPASKVASDLKVEIWAPVLAFILLAVIILIVWRVKRATARVTNHSVRSDRKPRDPDVDTVYENYASSDNGNNMQRGESYYSQLYTAYDDDYVEYKEPYAEYQKPKKGFRKPFQVIC